MLTALRKQSWESGTISKRIEFDELELSLKKLRAVFMHQEMTWWMWSLFSAINQFSSKYLSKQLKNV